MLGLSRSRLVLLDRLPAEAAGRYAELVEQRAARVPLQHLTGVAGFRRLDLAVGPGVFVPRPETEVLVDWAAGPAAARRPGRRPVRRARRRSRWPSPTRPPASPCTRSSGRSTRWPGRPATWPATGLPVALHRGDVADPACSPTWTGPSTWSPRTRRTSRPGPDVAARGGRARPAGRALGRRGRAGHHAGGRARRGPAAAARRAARGRARRRAGRVGAGGVPAWADVQDHRDLLGRPRFTTARRRPD